MTDYVKLAEAPTWVIKYPECSTCWVELETDGDGWTCPTCGTFWDMRANDGDVGTLYEDWSGEKIEGPVTDQHDAMMIGVRREREARARFMADLGAKHAEASRRHAEARKREVSSGDG